MSASWSASVIVGVKASEVYQERTFTATVTKYHPDTGVPYSTQVKQLARSFAERELPPLTASEEKYRSGEFDRDFSFLPGNLELFMPYHADNDGEAIVREGIFGVKVASAREDEWSSEIAASAVEAAKTAARDLLQQAGYSGEVKVYLLLSVGC